MKKFICAIATILFVLSLVSCTAEEIKIEPKTTIVKQDVSAVDKIVIPDKPR
jgi:hypothetical protein